MQYTDFTNPGGSDGDEDDDDDGQEEKTADGGGGGGGGLSTADMLNAIDSGEDEADEDFAQDDDNDSRELSGVVRCSVGPRQADVTQHI